MRVRDVSTALAVTTAVATAAGAAPLGAQEWRASAQAGRIRSSLDPVAAERLALGLQYDAATTGLRLTGGVPLRPEEPWIVGASGWTRLAVRGPGAARGFVAGVDLAGTAFLSMDRAADPAMPAPSPFPNPLRPTPAPMPGPDRSGHAFAGQAMPVLGYEGARLQLHARGGVSHYAATFGGQRADRTVQLADLQLTLAPSTAVAVVPVVRHFRASGEPAALFAGVSAVSGTARGSAWGSVGQWVGGPGSGMPWALGARVPLHARVALEGAARRDTYDPLYLQPAQTSWSVGLSVRVGGRGRTAMPPAPVPAAYTDGRATLRLPARAAAAQPRIAGDFNDWTPAPMTRDGAYWTFAVAVPPGVYHYAFVDAEGRWFVPEGTPGRKDDGMGGHVAVVVIR